MGVHVFLRQIMVKNPKVTNWSLSWENDKRVKKKKMIGWDLPQQKQHGTPAMMITGIIPVPTLYLGVYVNQSQFFLGCQQRN